jgi:hypothetical protein
LRKQADSESESEEYMPRQSKGARLWLRPADKDKSGNVKNAARWVIIDGGKWFSTGCGAVERESAEMKLADHLTSKYVPNRGEKPLSKVFILPT